MLSGHFIRYTCTIKEVQYKCSAMKSSFIMPMFFTLL